MLKSLHKYSLNLLYFLIQRKILGTLFFIILFPVTMYGAFYAWQKTENRVEEWIPSSFQETKRLVEFMGIFGHDEILMISWEGCEIGSPELNEFQRRLLAPAMVHGKECQLFQRVLTGTELYDTLCDEEFRLTDEQIHERLAGWIVSPDSFQTCLVAMISPDGFTYRQEAIEHVEATVQSIPGLSLEKVHIAGSTMESVTIDRASREYLMQNNILSYMLCIFLSWICSRNIRATMLVFLLAIFNQQVCLAIIYYSGTAFSSILMLVVNLTFVLSMSAGVHFVNYYRVAMMRYPIRLAPFAALKNAWTPTFLSTLTTVIGLLSFSLSAMIPIKKFGMYGAISLIASMLILLVYLGLAFVIKPIMQWKKHKSHVPRQDHSKDTGLEKLERKFSENENISPAVSWVVNRFLPWFTKKYYFWIITISVLLLVGGLAGLRQTKTAVGLRNMLLPSSKPIKDYTWLEDHFGPLIPVEVLIKVDAGEDDNGMMLSLRAMDAIREKLQEKPDNYTVISALNFLPTLPEEHETIAKTVYRRLVHKRWDELEKTGYIKHLEQGNYYRITVRAYAMRDVDYGVVIKDVEATINETLKQLDQNQRISFFVCGGVPLVYRLQTQLLLDLEKSFFMAFVLIAIVLCILLRSIVAGMLCFFPNVLPCVLVFGGIGWLQSPVEIGTVLTACAAIGIAVDNAIHFINWFRMGIREGLESNDAVIFALQRCGPAMVQTAMIFSLGMLVFAWNAFIPTICFALAISLLLTLALICDLVILPAILISPLGRFFYKK